MMKFIYDITITYGVWGPCNLFVTENKNYKLYQMEVNKYKRKII